MPARKEISLLPEEANANSFSAKFFKWATTIGRIILVFTNLIVILAFGSKFWLDRENADLTDLLRQQKAILEATQSFEKEYDSLQQRLSFIKTFYSKQPKLDEKVLDLVQSTPPDLVYDNITIETDENDRLSARLTLYAFDENSIVNYITNLIANPNLASVDVRKIERRSKENKYIINIGIIFKDESKKT